MYIENPEEDQINQNQSSSAPSVGAGGGGAAVGGGTSTGSTGTTGGNPSTIQPIQTNQSNQSFATVQDYLKANQQQGENFGNQFLSQISPGVGQAKSAIDTAAQNTQNEVTAATPTYNADTVKNLFSNPSDTTNVANYQKQANAQYTGPSSFESSDQYTNAANAANQATQVGQELGTTGGREQLLQDKFGVYGQGNKGLDQTLLQNSSAYPKISPLASDYQSIQDYLTAVGTPINTNAIPTAQAQIPTVQAQTSADVNAENQAILNNIQNRETAAVAKAFPTVYAPKFLEQYLQLNPQESLYGSATPEEIQNANTISAITNTPNIIPTTFVPAQAQSILDYLKQFYS